MQVYALVYLFFPFSTHCIHILSVKVQIIVNVSSLLFVFVFLFLYSFSVGIIIHVITSASAQEDSVDRTDIQIRADLLRSLIAALIGFADKPQSKKRKEKKKKIYKRHIS